MENLKIEDFINKKIKPIRIIATNEGETDSSEGTWQDFIEVKVPCLLNINAVAKAHYSGPVVNAGICLNIFLDEKLIASDFSFEGESGQIGFSSSASTTVFLEPGKRYNLKVDRADIRTNSNFYLHVNYFALYAEKANIIE
ncbi:hypothetical protein [Tenacibaculum agarivorans]|uniref:hypothetical protein n=1 Tax=Tenacibaculum agarivorans TaxID=1908389 RepID=UPI00094B8A63|nr:hypothetical protein [Tenacibaculum agarivorans]